MICTRNQFIASLKKSCARTDMFGADADFEKTFDAWITRLSLPKAAESLAAHLFVQKSKNELLRKYLLELNSSPVVVFAIDPRNI